jgi:hypothetical protein
MIANDCLPCNVKFMIEGEEEVLKVKLVCCEKNQEKLVNDVILISDTGMISNDQPSITAVSVRSGARKTHKDTDNFLCHV